MNRIEVIVVVGAVAILGVILMPLEPRGKAKYTPASCGGNLKQLGCAGALYEEDNQGFRPGPQPMGPTNQAISWDRPLAIQMGINLGKEGVYEPLANLTKVPRHNADKTLYPFACPGDPLRMGARATPVKPGSLADGIAAGKGICRSYTMNLGTGNLVKDVDDGISTTADSVPVKKIQSGAGMVYLIESHGYATVFGQRSIANDTYMICDKTGAASPKDAFTNPKGPMHGVKTKPRVNALMYDGHVELLEQETITANGGWVMQYHK